MFIPKLFTIEAFSKPVLPDPSILKNSRQLVVVVAPSWDGYEGKLQLFERKNLADSWHAVGSDWPIYLGRNGMGWSYQLSNSPISGPVKKEGDGKSPAGVFQLTTAFGFEKVADPQLKLSYIPIKSSTVCVDDLKSKYYNRKIIDSENISSKDWQSAEIMPEVPNYKEGIVVNYNTHGEAPGAGSCTFLHITGVKGSQGSAGCITMPEAKITALWHWFNPKDNPMLVALPEEPYLALKKDLGLPNIRFANSP